MVEIETFGVKVSDWDIVKVTSAFKESITNSVRQSHDYMWRPSGFTFFFLQFVYNAYTGIVFFVALTVFWMDLASTKYIHANIHFQTFYISFTLTVG